MLRKLRQKNPKSWDKWLKFALFAYREIPEASTSFSPFELTSGWQVKGLLSLVKDQWLHGDNAKNVISYVLEMRKQLSENLDLAHETLKNVQDEMKVHYDQKSARRGFEAGEQVNLWKLNGRVHIGSQRS